MILSTVTDVLVKSLWNVSLMFFLFSILFLGFLFILAKILKALGIKWGTDYREAYQPRQLLTKREMGEYLKLKQYADARGWLICPKVRLFDLIEPKSSYNRSDRQTLINKVWAKHVDFVLVDQSLNVIGVLELDDRSHDRPDRVERDQFVRDALEGAGFIMIQTRSITPETLDGFTVPSGHVS